MISKSIPFLIAAGLASVALGQTPGGVEKTFPFTYVDTPQQGQEIVNTMRAITEIQQASIDNVARSMTLAGTADQLAMAAWILPQVDLPAAQSARPQNSAAVDYRLGGSSNAVAHVFYLAPTNTPQSTQEMINAIRSVFEVQRIVSVYASRAVAIRGTAEQVAGTTWLINLFERPAGSQGQNLSYTFTTDPNDPRIAPYNAVRVFYPAHTPNPQATQEIVNSVRSIAELQRVVSFSGAGAIVARGTPDQIAMAQWLIDALDKPAAAAAPGLGQTPAVNQYQMAGIPDVARVFYLPPASPEALQEAVTQVRSAAKIQRVTSYSVCQAVVVRGTAGQVAIAAKLILDR